jgi:tetratricopeptide (TPR) repeat protein
MFLLTNPDLHHGLLGQYEKAIEKYRQSISVSPDRVDAYENLINALLALRRFDEAAQTAEQAQARKLDDTTLHNALYALAFLSRDSSGMEEQQRWYVGRIDENVGLSLQSDTEAYAGHMRKARELTTRAVDSAIRGDSKETAALWQEIAAQREAVSGNTAYATEAAVQGLKLYPASHEVKAEAALALAMAGDLSRAEALVQDLNRQYPHATQIQAIWLPSVADSPIELGTIDFVANLNCLYPKYIRAEAYLAAGQGTRAAAEFQKVVDNSGIVWNCWTGALARLGMARANALQAKNSTDADADAAHVRARRLQRFPHPLERRRSRHSHLQSSQS